MFLLPIISIKKITGTVEPTLTMLVAKEVVQPLTPADSKKEVPN